MIIAIICLMIYVIGVFADVKTTMEDSDGEGGVYEKNPRYQLSNGDANIPKLIRDKFIFGGIAGAIVAILIFSGLTFEPFGKGVAFFLFATVGIRHIIVAMQNRKIHNKVKRIHDAEKIPPTP